MFLFMAFAIFRGKLSIKRADDCIGLILLWPFTMMNDRMRTKLGRLLNPNS
jgi:hypothetical protein